MKPRTALFVVFLLASLFFYASAQERVSINELNTYLDRYQGRSVEVTGYLYVDEENDKIEVWETLSDLLRKDRFNWDSHIELEKGDYLPTDIDLIQKVLVVVSGRVKKTIYNYPQAGDNLEIALIEVDNFEVKEKNSFPPNENKKDFGDLPQAACDSCKFAILFCGYSSPKDFWNDIVQKYNYKIKKHKVCPDNIVVLFKGGTKDISKIPKGKADSLGNFASGGAFDCSKSNLKKAFDYIKKRMKAQKCKPAEFQFHSSTHGGGYHSAYGQGKGNDSLPHGYNGGILDKNNDETKNKTNENDVVFKNKKTFDIDGDGKKDIEVNMVKDPRDTTKKIKQVKFDSNGDGTFDKVIGYDFNGDGRVSKADSGWVAPDLNRNGKTDDVGWDDIMKIAGGEYITDDQLREMMQELIDSTGLDKAHSRAEFDQCFSGSFLDDLRGVTSIATSASARGEYSYFSNKYYYSEYEKHFIDSLAAGHSWTDAHKMAADSAKKHRPETLNPQISDNSSVCIVTEGPYRKENKICIKITNLCGKTMTVNPFIDTYNFGIGSPRLDAQRWAGETLKNNESKEYCINIPVDTIKYCFLGGVSYTNNKPESKSQWLNNVQYEVKYDLERLVVPFFVGGNTDLRVNAIQLVTTELNLPDGWEFNLSAEHVEFQTGVPETVEAEFIFPPNAEPGQQAHVRIEGWSESPTQPYVGYIELDVTLTGEQIFQAHLNSGWNLTSLTGIPHDPSIRDIFRESLVILTYQNQGGYLDYNDFVHGRGFWVLEDKKNTYNYPGEPNRAYQIELPKGWSIIGGLNMHPDKPEVIGQGEILDMFAFHPLQGYYPTTVVHPGWAAYINLSQPAIVRLSETQKQTTQQEQIQSKWEAVLSVEGMEKGFALNRFHTVFGVADKPEQMTMPPAPPDYSTYIQIYEPDRNGNPIEPGLYKSIRTSGDTLRWFVIVDVNGVFDDEDLQTVLRWDPDLLNNGNPNQRWIIAYGQITDGLGTEHFNMKDISNLTLEGKDNIILTIITYVEQPNSVETNKQDNSLIRITKAVPNPFDNSVELSYRLSTPAKVTVSVYDIFGRKIIEYKKGMLPQGEFTQIWNGLSESGQTVSNGNYYIRVVAQSGSNTSTAVKLIGKIK